MSKGRHLSVGDCELFTFETEADWKQAVKDIEAFDPKAMVRMMRAETDPFPFWMVVKFSTEEAEGGE